MKIIFFSNSCWSVQNFRVNLIKKLLKNHEVIILAPFDGYQKKLINLGCKVINIKIVNNKVVFFSDLILIFKIFKILFDLKKDSILLNFTIKPLIFGTFVSRLLKIPSICMITGLGTVFMKKNLLTFFVLFLYRIAFKNVFHVFFQNKDDKKIFLKHKIINRKNFSLIPGSGVDLKKFSYKKYNKSTHTTFLLVARLLKEKGIIEYINAGKLIKKKKINIKLNLVGSFIEDNKSSINKKIIFEAHKNNEINYLGFFNDVRPQIKKADCMVLPSYREGTPRSLLEGASMGRPIITTNAVGCREVLINKKNGFFCKIMNYSSLYLALIKFHKLSFNNKKKMSINSRNMVNLLFDEKKVISAYMTKIKESLKYES